MNNKDERMKWWRESRFGMFIHWGIYSILEKGEWIMYIDRIPVKEYEKLADKFNPTQFVAEEWVKLAKDSGMKYIVITAKHHDGFSMFKTKVDSFNIVDGTPYKKDVMQELSAACDKHGIRLCFYYTHVREWRHPHAQSLEAKSPFMYGNYGNFWDYPDENKKNLQKYLDDFDKPQLKELLSQYGSIGIIWFDTPSLIRPDQAQELVELVNREQPDCLTNSRVGDFADSDYYSLGDDEVPEFNAGVDFETPMTICHAWGYNNMPSNKYRDLNELLHQLVDIVSLGGNYLLNVGPDSMGIIPPEAQERLKGIGKWMEINGEAIYETKASPFPLKPSWGKITAKNDSLYLHVYQWSERISLTGIKSKVQSIKLLADTEREITWQQTPCGSLGYDKLTINLPNSAPDPNISVIKVVFDNPMILETGIIEDDTGSIQLPACLASAHSLNEKPLAAINITGIIQKWFSTDDWFSWEFQCEHPGKFEVMLMVKTDYNSLWDFGHKVTVEVGKQKNNVEILDSGIQTDRFQTRTFDAGTVQIDSEGLHSISVKASELTKAHGQGLTMSMVKLVPVSK